MPSRRPRPEPPTAGADATPHRRVLRSETIGPFLVLACDDGTTWVRGDPPRNELRAWAPGARVSLRTARAFVSAIDAADDRTTVARIARVLARRYAGDPALPDLLAWVDRRRQQLAAPSLVRPANYRP